jgi:hypothetical protein
MDTSLSLILDIFVLCGLGITIFYALRLSASLNNFRQHRAEFNVLFERLAKNIDQAYVAIDTLKKSSKESGEELQESVSEARFLIDELQMINETGNNLAQRLENLAEKSRYATTRGHRGASDYRDSFDDHDEDGGDDGSGWQDTLKKHSDPAEDNAGSPFSIQDKDFDTSTVTEFNPRQVGSASDQQFSSQAEKELYEALQKKKK